MITVLTPTYNRRDQLKVLAESLDKQTCKDFEWLIVDDGSNDDTSNVVEQFKANYQIEIRYIYKNNGGKHTALNCGIQNAYGCMIFIVDSDDWLTDDAIETIEKYDKHYHNEMMLNIICGYSFMRMYPDGKLNGKSFPVDNWCTSYITSRINNNDMMSDKAEVYYTRCLKEFPFPEIPGEKFIGEDTVWIRMARKYNMIHVNKPIYIGDYQSDGLTNNRRLYNIKSPNGCMIRAKEYLHSDVRFSCRIKPAIQYCTYGFIAGYKVSKLINGVEDRQKFMILLILPLSYLLARHWQHKYEIVRDN